MAILHKLILEKLLGIDEKKLANQSNIEYIKDTDNAIDESIANVDSGKKQVVFFMNPPRIKQIQMVADHGRKNAAEIDLLLSEGFYRFNY